MHLPLAYRGSHDTDFETDAALFIAEDGDITSRIEFEREFVFGQKTVLQPRLEVNLALQDIPELGLARGVTDIALGLRVRYEFTRKFAPYLGVSYVEATGSTADLREERDASETTLVAGVRFWF
jgi:copper resistance protein B